MNFFKLNGSSPEKSFERAIAYGGSATSLAAWSLPHGIVHLNRKPFARLTTQNDLLRQKESFLILGLCA